MRWFQRAAAQCRQIAIRKINFSRETGGTIIGVGRHPGSRLIPLPLTSRRWRDVAVVMPAASRYSFER